MAIPAQKASKKRLLIDKANATMLTIIGGTSFIVVFSLVASKALLSQSAYQSRVLKERQATLKQLKSDNENVKQLVASYKSFAGESQNVLGGNPTGSGPLDGDNPKIILDALPSKYDFPNLISSIEKLFRNGGLKLDSLGGTDDEVAQANAASDKPVPVEIPLPLTLTAGNEQGVQNALQLLERSIRPIYVNSLVISAGENKVSLSINAKTYYQPEKTLKIGTKVIK